MQRGVRLGVSTLHPCKPLEREQGLCLLVRRAAALARPASALESCSPARSRSPCSINALAEMRAIGAPSGDESSSRSRLASASSERARPGSPLRVMASARWIHASTHRPTSPIERASSRRLVRSRLRSAGRPLRGRAVRAGSRRRWRRRGTPTREACRGLRSTVFRPRVYTPDDQHFAEVGRRVGCLVTSPTRSNSSRAPAYSRAASPQRPASTP